MTDDRLVKFNHVSNDENGGESITVFVRGKGQFSATSDHPNFEAILKSAREEDENVSSLFNIALTAGTKLRALSDRITTAHGNLYLDGVQMHNALAEQIVQFVRDGVDDYKPLVNFYDKMAINPNQESVEHLYTFIEGNLDPDNGAFTITDDGNFIAYKGVKSDGDGGYRSTYSGREPVTVDNEVVVGYVPNKVGSVVSMSRADVVFDPSNHCSVGLHVGTFSYAKSYGSGGAMLKVLINPQDVVSVPNDSKEKMRVSKYKVLEIIKAPETKAVVPAESEDSDVEYDIRVGDVFEDRDKRRSGTPKKVVEINLDEGTAIVESKTLGLNITRKREIALSRLLSRKYRRVRRGRKQ